MKIFFTRRVKKECIDTIIGKSYVGDWFLFYLLGQNIDSVIFKVKQKITFWLNIAIIQHLTGRHTRIGKETWIQIPRHWRDLTH